MLSFEKNDDSPIGALRVGGAVVVRCRFDPDVSGHFSVCAGIASPLLFEPAMTAADSLGFHENQGCEPNAFLGVLA